MSAALDRLWYGSALYRLTLGGRVPRDLAARPADPWPGDAERGRDLLAGSWAIPGRRVQAQHPPWSADPAIAAWLHGFAWLRNLRALGGDPARRHARALVETWLQHFATWEPLAWRPDLLGGRVAAWIQLHEFLCGAAPEPVRRAVFQSLQAQARHLRRVLPGGLAGPDLLRAAKGLVLAGVALPDLAGVLPFALRLVEREADAQILPDGGPVSRDPARLVEVLCHLVEIRAALAGRREPALAALTGAIERGVPMLRFFRHGDGRLALFNGALEGDPALLDALLTHAPLTGKPPRAAPESGFARLAQGKSLVLMDLGAPPRPPHDRGAHAAPLAFEFSCGRERIVTNCGAAPAGGPWAEALRRTAAHSTASWGDLDAAELIPGGGVRRPPQVAERLGQDEEGSWAAGTHDGFAVPGGFVHGRTLLLTRGGDELLGEDHLTGEAGRPAALRFHLHPRVVASPIRDGAAVVLRPGDGSGWRFQAEGLTARLEESVYLGDGEPRRTQQIVLSAGTGDGEARIAWSFRRETSGRGAQAEPAARPADGPLPNH